jgi:hypothetical protein
MLLFTGLSGAAQNTNRLTQETETVSPLYNFDIQISQSDNLDLEFDISEITTQSKYYALIIGVSEYQDTKIKDLDQPVKDAHSLKKVLNEYYTFDDNNTIVLENPTQKLIIEKLDELSKKVSGNDNLLIFYAGHGKWDEKLQTGYWLPTDASLDNKSTWFSNSVMREYLKGIDSRHTLLIADACFSGGIFKTRSLSTTYSNAPMEIQKLFNEKSCKAITSGDLIEVPDNSVFMEYFVKELRKNKEVFTPTLNLFYNFRLTVINYSSQIPKYGVIEGTKDEGGEFIFIRKK